jgi:hypothetical protein
VSSSGVHSGTSRQGSSSKGGLQRDEGGQVHEGTVWQQLSVAPAQGVWFDGNPFEGGGKGGRGSRGPREVGEGVEEGVQLLTSSLLCFCCLVACTLVCFARVLDRASGVGLGGPRCVCLHQGCTSPGC